MGLPIPRFGSLLDKTHSVGHPVYKKGVSRIMKMNDRSLSRTALCFRAAEELGLLDKVLTYGWPGLTAEENGRVGAAVRRYLKEKE